GSSSRQVQHAFAACRACFSWYSGRGRRSHASAFCARKVWIMSWRWWAAWLGVCVAMAGACSGKSDSNNDEVQGSHGGSTAGGAGGTLHGHAGEPGDVGSGGAVGGGTAPTATAVTG